MSTPASRTSSLALLAAAFVLLTGCGSTTKTATAPPSTAPQSTAAASSPSSASPAISPGTVINFGDQQQNYETLLKASGQTAGLPYKLNFVEFDSGPLVDAGFAANRIDVGFMGDLPASLAAKSGLPVNAVSVAQPNGASEYLLAKPGITSIAQLKGKSVAYTTGTAEQAFALRALATAGLTQKDVHQVNVSLLQLGTVLESGAADASVVSVEQKVTYQQNHPGSTVLANIATTQPANYDYLLAATSALGDPAKRAAVNDLTRRMIAAANWQATHQTEWVNAYYVGVKHQAAEVAKVIVAAGGTVTFVPITAGVQSALQNVVTLLAGAGALPAPYSVGSLFNSGVSQQYNSILQEVSKNA
jgi:sulfonate transport system substrate-binding protein